MWRQSVRKRSAVSLVRWLAALLTLVAAACVWAADSSPQITDRNKDKILDRIGAILEKRAYAYGTDFDIWPEIMNTHERAITETLTEDAFADAVQKALNEFEISHLSIQSPTKRKERKSGRVREVVGIYMTREEDSFFVSRIVESSPAYEAGIRKGDTILSINGVPVAQVRRSNAGATSKRICWQRGDRIFEKDIEIREHPTDDPISVRWTEDGIAVVRIMSFDRRYYRIARANRVMKEAKRAKAIILDMRGNYGGYVRHYLHLAKHFARSSEAFHLRVSRKQAERIERRTMDDELGRKELLSFGTAGRPWGLPKRQYGGPVVILVDRHCASGGELFPAAMRDLGKAVVVGSRTRGGLLVSRSQRLGRGFQLYYPVFEISPPGGERIEGVGLEPDIVLSLRETATDAIIYEKAREVLRNWDRWNARLEAQVEGTAASASSG